MNPQRPIAVLLIEDNPADLEFIRLCIPDTPLKFQVLEAHTLQESMRILNSKQIDLILLDLSLPDSQGFKTLTRLLEQHPDVPLIVLTGTGNEIIGNQAVKAGAQDFLVKGQFDSKLLSRSIRYAIHRFSSQKELEATAKALTKSEKRYEEAQQLAQFGNWTLNLVDQKMHWSPQVYRLLGYTPEKLPHPTRQDYCRLVHPDDLERLQEFFDRFDSKALSETLEYRILYPDQTIRHLRLDVRLQEEQESREIVLFGVVQDVTNRKRSEFLQQEQQAFQKMLPLFSEALQALICRPETPIFRLLRDLPGLGNTLPHAFHAAFVDVVHAASLTLNLSHLFGRIPETLVSDFCPDEMVQNLVYIWNIQGKDKGVSAKIRNLSPVPARVTGPTAAIGELLQTAAVTVMPMVKAHTIIQLSQQFLDQEERRLLWKMELRAFRTDKHPEFPDGAFSTDQLLASMEQDIHVPVLLASRHALRILSSIGGQVRIKNYGQNKFRIELRILVHKAPTVTGYRLSPTFLLVDDHFISSLTHEKLLKELLPLSTVHTTSNIQEASEILQTTRVDAILIDLDLYHSKGPELAVPAGAAVGPLIALSTSITDTIEDQCLSAGFSACLQKPVSREVLEATLLRLLSSPASAE